MNERNPLIFMRSEHAMSPDPSQRIASSKEEQIEVINRLRSKEESPFYAIPNEWRKKWFLYCRGATEDHPGPIDTRDLVDWDWFNEVILFNDTVPLRKDAKFLLVSEPMFTNYVNWYGLQGPRIARERSDEYQLYKAVVSCKGKKLKFLFPRYINKTELYKLVAGAFHVNPDSIQNIEYEEGNGDLMYIDIIMRRTFELDRLDFSQVETIPMAGVVGLGNIGNTCYMASAVQALSQTRDLIIPMLSESHPLGHISYEFCKLMKALWTGTRSSLCELKDTLSHKEHRFASYSQQDSQELLAVLLDHLNEETKVKSANPEVKHKDENEPTLKDSWDVFFQRNHSLITKVFGGLLKSTVRCSKCNKSSVTYDPFLFLSLPIASGRTKAPQKLIVHYIGYGIKSIAVTPEMTIRDLKKAVDPDSPLTLVLVDTYRFIQTLDDENETVADYCPEKDEGMDFFDFGSKKKKGQVFAYPVVIESPLCWVNFLKPGFFSSDYCFFPLPFPKSANPISDIRESLREHLSDLIVDSLEIKPSDSLRPIYSIKVPNEHFSTFETNFFSHILPCDDKSAPANCYSTTLDDCLEEFEAEEHLSIDVGWKCNHCKKIRAAYKRLQIAQLPKSVLMIHLKRFAFGSGRPGWFGTSGSGRKVNTHINFPQHWTVQAGVNYQLYAVIEHYGSLFGGHYTCAARNFLTSQWHRYDDSSVREIDIIDVLANSQVSAYVLFYQIC